MATTRRRRPHNRGKKCIRRKKFRVKGQGMALRCAKFSGAKRRLRRKGKKHCKFGVNKVTGKCLKHRRRRSR